MTNDPLIKVKHVAADLSVAELDHPTWHTAERVHISQYWSGEPAPAPRHAEARVLWSPTGLHVRFHCPQHEPLVINPNPQTETKTQGLWDRDVCEIFLTPAHEDPNCYFEFEAAPTGEWIDLAICKTSTGRETDFEFQSGMSAAARIDVEQIAVALLIPWSARIPRPQPKERWRANLFRCIGRDPNRGYLAWQPTYTAEPSFHAPEVFGWLEFEE